MSVGPDDRMVSLRAVAEVMEWFGAELERFYVESLPMMRNCLQCPEEEVAEAMAAGEAEVATRVARLMSDLACRLGSIR